MNRKHSMLLKILLFLFFFNSLSLYLYFSPHPKTHSSNQSSLPDNLRRRPPEKPQHQLREFDIDHAKPWPILPSYLPWSHQNTQVPPGSCEGYFGNGFTRRLDLLRPTGSGGGSGWFRCLYSGTLRSSICEGGRVRMVPERIKMSRGGERLEEVIGRGEEVELPEFEDGAFEVDGGDLGFGKEKKLAGQDFLDRYVPEGEIMRHTMRALVKSIRVVGTKEFECEEWVEEPTLLVTRFEYANLFHTVTDWYSAYVASRVTGLPNRPRLVFVDGHCVAQLEETWRALFSGIKYAKDFTGPVCFRHAILSPLGYETVLFKGLNGEVDCVGAQAHDLWQNPDTHKTARLSEFGEIIRASFGLPIDKHHLHKNASGYNVLFVRREDYLAHPRHGGKVESRLSNEQEVFDALKRWAASHSECKVNLVNGLFAHMSMKEQVRAIQDASVIVGAHGAGLTHIVAATPDTVILEIISVEFRRPHFQYIAQWKGLKYHAINLDDSYANPSEVIDRLSGIMTSLGC